MCAEVVYMSIAMYCAHKCRKLHICQKSNAASSDRLHASDTADMVAGGESTFAAVLTISASSLVATVHMQHASAMCSAVALKRKYQKEFKSTA